MGTDLKTLFYSHPGKFLHDHLEGVAIRTEKRTTLKFAKIAATFHDLGKLTRNFQDKLQGKKVGYSSHAYLSAVAWLCFWYNNKELVKELIGDDPLEVLAVLAMVARHHGDLPDFTKRIFNELPGNALKEFLITIPYLPISDFLQNLLKHKPFNMPEQEAEINRILKICLTGKNLRSDRLNFFLNTQFGFACLIEADKRDASENDNFNREKFSSYFRENLSTRLIEKLEKLNKQSSLDILRTQMREDVIENIRPRLKKGERVFTLSAPTGAGKTIMLLSLAKEIYSYSSDLAIIYALPFLSITEQVESICRAIYYDNNDAIQRIDSKSANERIDELQKDLDADPDKIRKLLQESFSEATFDHPFIITTFVQLFETMVSNRNSTLLKLPNFSQTIFLIDEIQALPPRLYIFFTALLHEFCHKFNSYAVISTATMPYLEIPNKKDLPDNENPKLLFKNYQKPEELLSNKDYYRKPEFNRYRIELLEKSNLQIEDLAQHILKNKSSCLVILNTIDDTKQLYKLLGGYSSPNNFQQEYQLLNTHFTISDRRNKLAFCKQRLLEQKRIVLVSTQLIEAGVDIDFPMLYRDLCPLPNLIQSAGRCNRNSIFSVGLVFLFELTRDSGLTSASLIYRDEAKDFLNFCKTNIVGGIMEIDLLEIQKRFFEYVQMNLKIGLHKQSNAENGEIDMVKCINSASFEELGKFQLIDEKYAGVEYRYYIPQPSDSEFERLLELADEYKACESFDKMKQGQLKIEAQLRKMSEYIVNFRIPQHSQKNAPPFSEECMGIRKLSLQEDYSTEFGIKFDSVSGCII